MMTYDEADHQAKIARVAKAIKDAIPGLQYPEAWPWLTMAEAAIYAIESEGDAASRRLDIPVPVVTDR
jgi:hypothetical protein